MGFIIAAAVAAAVIAFCFLCYKKAPPTQAIVVTGFGLSRPKVVCGRGVFVLPIVQRADRLNMRLLKIDVKTPETGVKTKEGVSLWLDSVVTVQVYSENSTVSDEEVRNAGYDDIRKYINSSAAPGSSTPLTRYTLYRPTRLSPATRPALSSR